MAAKIFDDAYSAVSARLREFPSSMRAMSWLQRIATVVALTCTVLVILVFAEFGSSVLVWITPLADSWRSIEQGWMVIWMLTFLVALPPLVGYSSLLAICGFVYGMPGWFIAASATVAGSTASFLLTRHVVPSFARRLVSHDRYLTVLSQCKYDNIGSLILLRLCPLPYSLANGAIAAFPEVTWSKFTLATAVSTAKLALYIFVGDRLAKIGAFDEDEQDSWDRTVYWAYVYFGLAIGFGISLLCFRLALRRSHEYASTGEQGAASNEPEYAYIKESEILDEFDHDKSLESLVEEDEDSDDGDHRLNMHKNRDVEKGSPGGSPRGPPTPLLLGEPVASQTLPGERHPYKRQPSEYPTTPLFEGKGD